MNLRLGSIPGQVVVANRYDVDVAADLRSAFDPLSNRTPFDPALGVCRAAERPHCGQTVVPGRGCGVLPALLKNESQAVFTHSDGIVDTKYLASVPNSLLQEGQRLTVTEPLARQAVHNAEHLCRALSLSVVIGPDSEDSE